MYIGGEYKERLIFLQVVKSILRLYCDFYCQIILSILNIHKETVLYT